MSFDQLKIDLSIYEDALHKLKDKCNKIDIKSESKRREFESFTTNLKDGLTLQIGRLRYQRLSIIPKNTNNNFTALNNDLENINTQIEEYKALHNRQKLYILEMIPNPEENLINNYKASEYIPDSEQIIRNIDVANINHETRKPTRAEILKCRLSDYPFIVDTLRPNKQFKCHGCKNFIQPFNYFLSHNEEYPVNSGRIILQSYHVDHNCLFKREFPNEYLAKIKVLVKVRDKNIHENLKRIGFQIIEDFRGFYNDDAASSVISEDLENSDIESIAESDLSTNPRLTFHYRFLLSNSEKIMCYGCNSMVKEGTNYLNFKQREGVIRFHVQKKCLLSQARVTEEDLANAICCTFKNLKTFEDTTKLLSCGFSERNMKGYIPRKPKFHKSPPNLTTSNQPVKPKQNINNADKGFIINLEPFEMIFSSPKGAICSGCELNIESNAKSGDLICLSHKEVIPRSEKLKQYYRYKRMTLPAVTQYYHVKKSCLMERGFTVAYLSKSICKTHKDTNPISIKFQKHVQSMLERCEFSARNIQFNNDNAATGNIPQNLEKSTSRKPNSSQFPAMALQGASNFNNPYIRVLKYQALSPMLNTDKCDGCKNKLYQNGIFIIYGISNGHDSEDDKLVFHLNCFKNRYKYDDIKDIRCLVSENVDQAVIIECGLNNNNIIREPLSTTRKPPIIPQQNLKGKEVYMENLPNHEICLGCHQKIYMGCFCIYIKSGQRFHVKKMCLQAAGYTPDDIKSFNYQYLTHDKIKILADCGFQL